MADSNTRRDAHSARVMLRVIGGRQASSAAGLRARIEEIMGMLDTVILQLPCDPPDSMVSELDRIVTTLRTADEHVLADNKAGAEQSLDLAGARLQRFAKTIENYDPASTG